MAERAVLIRLGSKLGPDGNKGIRQMQSGIDGLQKGALNVGKYLVAGTLGAGAAAFTAWLVRGTQDALAFGKAMAEISTIVDTTQVNMAALNKQILDLSRGTGKGPEELAKALYQTVSSGVEAGQAMQFVEKSAKTAIGAVASVTEVVDMTTNVLNAYGMTVKDVDRINDVAFKTVEKGKTTYSELAASMGQVLPFAAQLNISLEDLFGAVGTLTLGGNKTSDAVTYLKGVMTSVIKPSEEAAKVAELLGIDFSAAALKAKGFAGFLADIREKTGGNTEALSALFENVRGLTAVLALAGEQAGTYVEVVDTLTNSQGAAGEAFKKVAESDAFKFEKALNDIKVSGVEVGQKVLPSLTRVVTALGPAVAKLADFLGDVAEGLAAVLEGGEGLAAFVETAAKMTSPLAWVLPGRKKSSDAAYAKDVAGTAQERWRKAFDERDAAGRMNEALQSPEVGKVTEEMGKQVTAVEKIARAETERSKAVAKIMGEYKAGADSAAKLARTISEQYGLMNALERGQVRKVLAKLQGSGQAAFEGLSGSEMDVVGKSSLLKEYVKRQGFAERLASKELGAGLVSGMLEKVDVQAVMKNEITAKLEIDGPSLASQITEKVLPKIWEVINASIGKLTGSLRSGQQSSQAVAGAAAL